MSMSAEDLALVELGSLLRRAGYRHITTTPASHKHVNARPANAEARTLAGALGWSRPFRPGTLATEVERLLATAGALVTEGERVRSAVRFSTVDPPVGAGEEPGIFVHSAYPTAGVDAVFFGPDTYRFIGALRRELRPARRLVEVGAGSGAAALSLAGRSQQVVLADINQAALRLARVNAALAGVRAEVVESDVLAGVTGPLDAIVAHPPFMVDPERRLYRDGGGARGYDLAVRITGEALARLEPGGQYVLFTGSAVVDGVHPLREALAPVLAARACEHTWEEVDPDVYGEELASEIYADVDRIALVVVTAKVK
jgi:release factor glutamine methyltransferase